MIPLSRGWRVVLAYSVVAAGTQALWLTFAPIDTAAAHHYGVSSGTIGWLSEIVPLVYIFLALPAGRLLDLHFRPILAMGATLLAAGGMVRLGGPTFAWALAGQALVAASQPFVLGAVAKLAGDYLPEEQRPAGIAIGASAGFAGMLFALLAGPTIGGHGQIQRLLVVEAAIAVVSALALVWALRKPGPEEIANPGATVQGGLVRALWSLPDMRAMARLVFVGFGIFTALMTWLQVMLEPAGISEGEAGILLLAMLVVGMVGCAVLPPALARRGLERQFLRAAVLVAATGPALLALDLPLALRGAILAALGFALLPALPVLLTAAERLAGVEAAGTSGSIIWLAGNLGAIVVSLLVQALVHDPVPAFLVMAAVALLALPAAGRFSVATADPTPLGETPA